MADNNIVIINKFINVFWKWIRDAQIPKQTDNDAWDKFNESTQKLIHDFESEYNLSEELHWMFIKWVNDYREYVREESKNNDM